MGSEHSTNRKYHDYYKSLNIIGEGGFCIVKQCLRLADNKYFAVKIIRKSALKQNELQCIRNEIRLLANIVKYHPNIIEISDYFETKYEIRIVLELCQSYDLFDIIAKKYPNGLPESIASQVIYQLMIALKFLHNSGIVHRDIKPENILFTFDGILKLTDFNFAHYQSQNTSKSSSSSEKNKLDKEQIQDSEDDNSLAENFSDAGALDEDEVETETETETETEVINNNMDYIPHRMKTQCGTPYYAAPELLSGKIYEKEVDLWSVGVTLYFILCGKYPFNGSTYKKMFLLIIRGLYTFPPQYWENISNDAKDLINKLLNIDPKKRIKIDDILNHPWIKKYNDDKHK